MGDARLALCSRQPVSIELLHGLPTRLRAESLDRRLRWQANGLTGTAWGVATTEGQPREFLPKPATLP